jgi:hypothetical protein
VSFSRVATGVVEGVGEEPLSLIKAKGLISRNKKKKRQ